MNNYYRISTILFLIITVTSCSKDSDDSYGSYTSQSTYTPPPTSTSTTTSTTTNVTQYTLTASAGVGGTVSTLGGTYDDGTSITITASANDGYEFTGWNGSDMSSSTITITLNSNTSIEAIFSQVATLSIGENINFVYNLHESLPDNYINEFNTIMDNLIEMMPAKQQSWLFNPDLNIYAWNNIISSPFIDANGNPMQGASISGNGSSFWMVLEIPSDEFTNNSMHRYSVIAHEYFHVYQMSLSESFAAPSDGTNPNAFDVLWLAEGAAASFESLFIQQYYGINYFDEGQAWGVSETVLNSPESYESRNVQDMNYSNSVFMILALIKELEKVGFSTEKAFQSVYKTFWESNPNNTNWKNIFEEVFTISVDNFYTMLESYTADMSLIYPSSSITLQDIINDSSTISTDTTATDSTTTDTTATDSTTTDSTTTDSTTTDSTTTDSTTTDSTTTDSTTTDSTTTDSTTTDSTTTDSTTTDSTTTDSTTAESTSSTYSITVTAQNSSNYILSGSDQNGNVSGNDPSISAKVGDTFSFIMNSPGHPFYLIKVSNGGTDSGNLIDNVTNNGASSGTISWTPSEVGTYYYICEYHASMLGTISITE